MHLNDNTSFVWKDDKAINCVSMITYLIVTLAIFIFAEVAMHESIVISMWICSSMKLPNVPWGFTQIYHNLLSFMLTPINQMQMFHVKGAKCLSNTLM